MHKAIRLADEDRYVYRSGFFVWLLNWCRQIINPGQMTQLTTDLLDEKDEILKLGAFWIHAGRRNKLMQKARDFFDFSKARHSS